jgi:hypothetical protein
MCFWRVSRSDRLHLLVDPLRIQDSALAMRARGGGSYLVPPRRVAIFIVERLVTHRPQSINLVDEGNAGFPIVEGNVGVEGF